MKALIISADNFEDTELLVPYYRLKEEGIHVDIASMKKGTIKGKHGYKVEIDKTLKEVNPDDYDILILPGGKAPETVRKEKEAMGGEEEYDEKYDEAVAFVAETGQASISLVQRRFRIGYNRAARIIEKMEEEGVVGLSDGVKPREVLIKKIE